MFSVVGENERMWFSWKTACYFYRAALQLIPNYFLKYGLIVHIYILTSVTLFHIHTYIGNFI